MKYKWGILNHNITYINEKQLIHIKWMKKWVTIVEGLMVGDRKMTIGYIRWCFGEFVCKFKVFQGRGVAGAGWGAGGLGGVHLYSPGWCWLCTRNRSRFILQLWLELCIETRNNLSYHRNMNKFHVRSGCWYAREDTIILAWIMYRIRIILSYHRNMNKIHA